MSTINSSSGDKVAAAIQSLKAGVERLRESGEFRRYLDTMSRFHSYSFGNVMLIQIQRPGATHVAGFCKWLEMGRTVRKGEKGIAILAPQGRRACKHDESEECTSDCASVYSFRVVHVFDISQTDGDPLPEIANRLTGDDGALFARLEAVATAEGLNLNQDPRADLSDVNGFYTRMEQSIWVRPEMDRAMQAKTLAHELAHHFAGHDGGQSLDTRDVRELVAEASAYVVLNHFGIDSGDYSFGYVTAWGGDGNKVDSHLKEISQTAHTIIDKVDGREQVSRPPEIRRMPDAA